MNRKDAIKTLATGAAVISTGVPLSSCESTETPKPLKGNINHSACRWCYDSIPIEDFFEKAKDLGLVGIDLLAPSQWAIAKKYGLKTTMANPEKFDLTNGFNDLDLHGELQETYTQVIEGASAAGLENVICFSGNRRGLSDEQGLENCAVGLESMVKLAEKNNIILSMELLNSKVNHPDYQCDKSAWGVSLVEKIGSPNFKLLYDIYHMQIMEGDVIATIKKNSKYYSHYHTGGVPGRNEINETQELNYPAIMKAILATGFTGYVAQEFVPTREDKMESLKEGVMICDV